MPSSLLSCNRGIRPIGYGGCIKISIATIICLPICASNVLAADSGYVPLSDVTVNERGIVSFVANDVKYSCRKAITDPCLKILLAALGSDRSIKAQYRSNSEDVIEVHALSIR